MSDDKPATAPVKEDILVRSRVPTASGGGWKSASGVCQIHSPAGQAQSRNTVFWRELHRNMQPVPAEAAATAALYLVIKDAGLSRVQLAAVLGVDEKEVRRLLDPHHASKLPRLEAALEKIGKRLVISVADVEEVAAGTK